LSRAEVASGKRKRYKNHDVNAARFTWHATCNNQHAAALCESKINDLRGNFMNIFKKVLVGVALITAFGGIAQASPISVGGVTWNPDATSPTDGDFTARFEFNQFFTSGANQVANLVNAAANYANAINAATVGLGDVLQGAGEINKINGVNYGDTASNIGGAFCPSCELTFVFGGFAINGPNSLSNGWLRLYVDDTPDFDVANSAAANAADGVVFLELTGVTNSFAGMFQAGFLTSYFNVTGGIAAPNFNTNTKAFASDLVSSASALFDNPNFLATSTGQISGNSIPEPSSIFLLSLALLGLAFVRRQAANK
jgi:hypothetical protein